MSGPESNELSAEPIIDLNEVGDTPGDTIEATDHIEATDDIAPKPQPERVSFSQDDVPAFFYPPKL